MAKAAIYVRGYNRHPTNGRNIWMFQANKDDPEGDEGFEFREWLEKKPTSKGRSVDGPWCGPEWVKSTPSVARLRDEAAPGDWVFLYQAQPTQAIVGLGRFHTEGYVIPRWGPSKTWFDMDWWMKTPLLRRDRILAEPKLRDMEFLRMKQGTIFRVSPAQAETLLSMMSLTPAQRREVSGAWDAPLLADVAPAGDGKEPANRSRTSGSAGFQQDTESRLAVEKHAERLAFEYYKAEGWSVEVKGKPYDLLCVKGKKVLHVEVKGTTTDGCSVRLTINEVEDARDRQWRSDLFVVSDIRLKTDGGKVLAEGGNAFVLENWAPAERHLAPKEFLYSVPVSGRRSV